MALEEIYFCSRALKRHRTTTLGSLQDGFQEWLKAKGFGFGLMRTHISRISRFGEYLGEHDVSDYSEVSSEHIESFLSETFSRRKDKKHRGELHSINRFLQYLREEVGEDIPAKNNPPYQKLLEQYLNWLKDHRQVSAGTIRLRSDYLRCFFNRLGSDEIVDRLESLSTQELTDIFVLYSREHSYSARRSMQATLRTFFVFCYLKGLTPKDLSTSIPTLRTYKLDTVPRGISEENANRVLSQIDRSSAVGRRDYAILLLLYHYGVRGAQVRHLRLTDINWRRNEIYFRKLKHGKSILLPLLDIIGAALLDYLQNVRPEVSFPEVFLTVHVPYRPFSTHSGIYQIVSQHIQNANVSTSPRGAHSFRHGFATRMLNEGNSLKAIADVLGHSCIASTQIYTKVDFTALREVALELPTEGEL